MNAVCPVCKIDAKNATNLASHLRAKHPDYTTDRQQRQRAQYERNKVSAARISAEKSHAGADIAPLPEVADPARKAACEFDLERFLKTYFPKRFPLAFSPTHKRVIQKIQRAVLGGGGTLAYGMRRGGGKTQLATGAAVWALVYGHKRYVVLIGATEAASDQIMGDLKGRFADANAYPDLHADFPEVCYPVASLEGITQKAKKQHIGGAQTHIEWTQDHIRLPIVEGSRCPHSIIQVASMTGAIRGKYFNAPDGSVLRPDLALVDDPQTRESAKSPTQTDSRIQIVQADVRGLGGDQGITVVMPCTIIYENDLADQMLSRDRYPEWQGEKAAMVNAFPTNEKLWEEYFKTKDQDYRSDGDGSKATAFYLANREQLDAGAVLDWPERFDPPFASGVEQAMHLRHYNPEGFASEYQNKPMVPAGVDAGGRLTAEALRERTNHLDRWELPPSATRITAGIDVQKRVIFWAVCAWGEDFGGAVIDWGVYPKQKTNLFRAADPRPSLEDTYPQMDDMARIHAGLKWVTDYLLSQDHRPERILIDSGNWTSEINQFCRFSPHRSALIASKGYGGGLTRPLGSYKVEGQRKGPYWVVNPLTEGKRQRNLVFDTHYWKSFLRNRLKTAAGSAGCLWLPGGDNEGLISHLTAEQATSKTNNNNQRTIEEWGMKPGRSENHWWDCLVMATVAASELGLRFDAGAVAAPPGSAAPARPAPTKRRYVDPRLAQQAARSGPKLPGRPF